MEKSNQESALRFHIKRRLTRKPNRVIKRSFIESAMCNHNIVLLLVGMLVVLASICAFLAFLVLVTVVVHFIVM